MKKFFDKEIADQLGHVAATEIAWLSTNLHAEMESIDAIRRAQGRPTLREEEERDRKEMAALIAEFGEDGFDPLVVTWALGRDEDTSDSLEQDKPSSL